MHILGTKKHLLALSAICGASGMALEVSAARLFAPHYGTSTLVWSSVIGVVLLSLSLGYYLGGTLVEKHKDIRVLLLCILGAGLFTLAIPVLANTILGLLTLDGSSRASLLNLSGGSLLATILLFGFPTMLLGIVSPFILSLLTTQSGHLGNTSGQLFAVSTLGGLAGTFLPNLLLIPLVGTTWAILGIGALLTLCGVWGIPTKKNKGYAVLAGVLLAITSTVRPASPNTVIAAAESPYQYIQIIEPAAGVRYMQFDSGFGFQSVYHTDTDPLQSIGTPEHEYTYYEFAASIPALLPEKDRYSVLCIGLAGGTLPHLLHTLYKDKVSITAVEIDSVATDLAKEYMGLRDIPLSIHHADGRPFLAHSSEKYDFIYVDAYQNELQIPWQLTTKEFWQLAEQRLTPNGILGMNIAALGSKKSSLVAAIANTQAQVFPFVYDAALEERRNASHLLLASNHELTTKEKSDNKTVTTILEDLIPKLNRFYPDSSLPILTDNHAPTEWIIARDLSKQ